MRASSEPAPIAEVARSAEQMAPPPAPTVDTELRIALAMRGGVSLSIWIGGAVREIDGLRRDLHRIVLTENGTRTAAQRRSHNSLADLAYLLGRRAVTIDVLTGASAGGLNAVILGTAMVAGNPVDPLRDVWIDTADIERLIHPSSRATKLSLLSGDFFLNEVQKGLHTVGTPPTVAVEANQAPPVPRLDVLLSVTTVVPMTTTTVVDPALPTTEQRIDGVIRYRHRAGSASSHFPSPGGPSPDDVVPELALGARSTASFPVAFEPVDVTDQLVGKLELRPMRPERVLLYDGGVVDNMPVGKAVRAIETSPAGAPTDRVLLYLHPSPSPPTTPKPLRAAAEVAGRRPFDVLRSATKALRGKSLSEDLQELDRHNRSVERQRRDRARLLAHFDPRTVPDVGPAQVADLNAERMVDMLVSPWDHVEAATELGDIVPPLLHCSPVERETVTDAIRACLEASVPQPESALPSLAQDSPRPWGPVIRAASLLIEWAHILERESNRPTVSAIKEQLHRIRDIGYTSGADLNVATLARGAPTAAEDLSAWAHALVSARLHDVRAIEGNVLAAWTELGELATRLGVWSTAIGESAGDPGLVAAAAALPKTVGSTSTKDALAVLDALDRVLLPLHRNTPQGSLETIRYLTLSGQAPTPLAPNYPWPDQVSETKPRALLRTLRPQREPGQTRGLVDPASKLAGNQLHNFAAFLRSEWRANDWMWGQIDAATTLLDVLLPVGEAIPASLTLDELATIFLAPFPRGPESGLRPKWGDQMTDVTRAWWNVLERLIEAELASGEPLSEQSVIRSALLLRRHLELLGTELSRPQPSPAPVADDAEFAQAVEDWNRSSRSLAALWGERRTTALGMRAAFVGWRAFFAQLNGPLAMVRGLLAPVLAPLVGLVLARRRSIAAIEILLAGVAAPRVTESTIGKPAVFLLAVAVLVGGLSLTRDPVPRSDGDQKPIPRPWHLTGGWSLTAIAAVAALAAFLTGAHRDAPWVLDLLPPASGRSEDLARYALPVASVGLALWITWFWAKWTWRIAVTVMGGGIVWSWVWLAGHPNEAPTPLTWVASIWFGLAAVILITTLIGYNVDVADSRTSRWVVRPTRGRPAAGST